VRFLLAFFAKQTEFRPHRLRLHLLIAETMPRLKIVIPNGRPASGISAYGKWWGNADLEICLAILTSARESRDVE
jgi:hypothetical protein